MTVVLLIILAIIWAAVLVPPWLRRRREARPTVSIASFHQQLAVLSHIDSAGRVAQRPSVRMSPAHCQSYATNLTRADARRRRGEVLLTLVAAAVLTLVLAVVLGGIVWPIHLLVDVLTVAYVVALARTQRRAAERQAKVRYLPTRPTPQPALLLRRSASN